MKSTTNNESSHTKRRDRIKIDLLVHDLKVPLAVIEAGITALLFRQEKYGSLTEKQEKVLLRVLRNTKTTQTLVKDALELGRSREGIISPSELTLSDLIEQALVEIFDLADHHTSEQIKACSDLSSLKTSLAEQGLDLCVDERLWCEQVCVDEGKITQILRNLLTNALKYRKHRVELAVRQENGQLVFSVTDDGEGIPSVYHQRIFDSYFQMEPNVTGSVRGHGLGLAGVMVLVEDLGGRLRLQSDEGKGAQFLVEMPLMEKPTE